MTEQFWFKVESSWVEAQEQKLYDLCDKNVNREEAAAKFAVELQQEAERLGFQFDYMHEAQAFIVDLEQEVGGCWEEGLQEPYPSYRDWNLV